MRVTITIDADGAAFSDDGTPWEGPELARILREIAAGAEHAGTITPESRSRAIIDANGNRCGIVHVIGDHACADCGQPADAFREEHDAHLCDGCADDRRDCAEAQDAWDAHYGKDCE